MSEFKRRGAHAGFRFFARNSAVLFSFQSLSARLRSPEIGELGEGIAMLGHAVLIVLCVGLFAYLLAALLWPEKF